MIKALFINGSPRKNGNTAQLLKRAMDGAREAGAEVELVNLYDRSLNYKGCMSCFACKLKGGKKGVCSFKDDLQPILQKAVEADVLVWGGLIGAAAWMRPSKCVQDMELKSLKKKYKSKGFAAGCSREVIEQGAAMLGWPLDDVLQKTLDAMRACESDVASEMEKL
ncbi:MAG: NAD(P)H-dependent oxidoreductase [Bacteroidaceae bacterium]|nr:NAD(P)H-dependent oxidoreductase [Bacteroidaceae bacterium]